MTEGRKDITEGRKEGYSGERHKSLPPSLPSFTHFRPLLPLLPSSLHSLLQLPPCLHFPPFLPSLPFLPPSSLPSFDLASCTSRTRSLSTILYPSFLPPFRYVLPSFRYILPCFLPSFFPFLNSFLPFLPLHPSVPSSFVSSFLRPGLVKGRKEGGKDVTQERV